MDLEAVDFFIKIAGALCRARQRASRHVPRYDVEVVSQTRPPCAEGRSGVGGVGC